MVRGVGASSNHQRRAGEITGASRAPAGSSYGNTELKKRRGRDWDASEDPRASTNEHINERIKKRRGRVSPTPSPAAIAPPLRGVASFG